MLKNINNINIRRIYYRLSTRYFTFNNILAVAALILALSWAWASVEAMQRNFSLEKEIANKQQQLKLIDLQTQTLQLQKRYHETEEYQKLEVRRRLGAAEEGEGLLILPPNSEVMQAKETAFQKTKIHKQARAQDSSNLKQWLNFLFGGTKSLRQG